jgi:hypothetical protein
MAQLPAAATVAIACDEIYLVDDGNSAVSLPESSFAGRVARALAV